MLIDEMQFPKEKDTEFMLDLVVSHHALLLDHFRSIGIANDETRRITPDDLPEYTQMYGLKDQNIAFETFYGIPFYFAAQAKSITTVSVSFGDEMTFYDRLVAMNSLETFQEYVGTSLRHRVVCDGFNTDLVEHCTG